MDFPISSFVVFVWSGFFVKWHINLRGLFNAKAIHIEEQQYYYLAYC